MGLDMYLERCKNVVFPYVNKDIEELKESEKEDDKRLLEFLKPYIRKKRQVCTMGQHKRRGCILEKSKPDS